MRPMTFWGFLNDDGTVTRAAGNDGTALPEMPVKLGSGNQPSDADYANKEMIAIGESCLSGRKYSDMTILGWFEQDIIVVDHEGRCYRVDCSDDASTK